MELIVKSSKKPIYACFCVKILQPCPGDNSPVYDQISKK